MLTARDLELGALYRHTRVTQGLPNTYYKVLEPWRVKGLKKRLERRNSLSLNTRDLSILRSIERGHVLVESYHRYTNTACQKVEYRTVFGVGPGESVHLRRVKSRPGYR